MLIQIGDNSATLTPLARWPAPVMARTVTALRMKELSATALAQSS